MQYMYDTGNSSIVPFGVTDKLTAMGMQQREHVLLRIDGGSDTCGIYVPDPRVCGTYRWLGSLPIGPAYIITRVLGQTQTLHTTGDYRWICLFRQRTTLELCEHTVRQITGRLRSRSLQLAVRLQREGMNLGQILRERVGYYDR